MEDKNNVIHIFLTSFCLSSFAGIAALLRGGKEVTRFNLISAALNSGLIGLCISLMWYTKFQDNVYFLIGVCILAGLGGATTIDFVLSAVKAGGFNIKIGDNGVSMKEEKKND